MCPAIVIFIPLKLPICSARLCTVVFNPPSSLNSPFTAAFAFTPGTWQRKPNREVELPIMLIRYSPSIPWTGDTGSGRRTCWLWWGLLSFALHPTSKLQQSAVTPRLRAAWWYKTSTAITLIGDEPRWKPLLQIAELWREVLTPHQELISKRVFFPECIYPLLIARVPGPLAVIKKAIPAKCWGSQKLIRMLWMLNLSI